MGIEPKQVWEVHCDNHYCTKVYKFAEEANWPHRFEKRDTVYKVLPRYDWYVYIYKGVEMVLCPDCNKERIEYNRGK